MRELFLARHESTETSLVFRADNADTGEEFFFAVTDDLKELLVPGNGEAAAGNPSETNEGGTTEETQRTTESTGAAAEGSAGSTGLRVAGSQPAADSEPRRSEHLTMSPAEVQHRIRAGATAAELAEEMGVVESRVESFAHPVMLERERISELAKQAHPVREDGPAKLTLWEILATAFAARGHSLSEATWDAVREKGEPWVVKVTWRAGLSENEAVWTFKQSMTSPATVVARNSVAADLTDPDFVQPVRSLTSVGRGSRYDKAIDGHDSYYDEFEDAPHDAADAEYTAGFATEDKDFADTSAQSPTEITRDDIPTVESRRAARRKDGKGRGGQRGDSKEAGASEDSAAGEDFLQNPDPQSKPKNRRRKAVTPHWEDVLLGVRANTKRPRD